MAKLALQDLNKLSKMSQEEMQLFFGDHWVVLRGQAFDTDAHRHHAAQWAYAVSGSISADLPSGYTVQGQGLFVPPDHEHAFHANSDVVMVYWEPEHTAYTAFAGLKESVVIEEVQRPQGWPSKLSPDSARRLAYDCLDKRSHEDFANTPLDSRVKAAQNWITEHLNASLDVDSAADAVHLSAPHLSRLFRTECGTTFRAYVRWRRLRRAVEIALAGASLTEAAHASGFSDSAHLSRTFREMFGVSPRFLFGRRQLLQVELVVA